ncbi:hypothetical protein ACF073_22610 [Streptomyces sp. NPDC015171]|uniref:hypothetical protein n=1 Tax=Streptomyces sp. NPDC015171 TaxID=3364945 RepID=UPI003702E36F
MFDSGLSALLDVLDAADAMRTELPETPPPWNITKAGFRRRVRTGGGGTWSGPPR